jgi:hypothetical protein
MHLVQYKMHVYESMPCKAMAHTTSPILDSVGTLLPSVEARILREDGSEADVNEAGELYVRVCCFRLLEQRESIAKGIHRWLGTHRGFSPSGPEWLLFVSWPGLFVWSIVTDAFHRAVS